MVVRSNVTLKKNFSTRETRRFRRAIHDTTVHGLSWPCRGSFCDFLAAFSPSPALVSTPRGGHIFPTTSAKVFISSGDDVRDGEAPLFTASASPFLSLAHNTPHPLLPTRISRSVSRSGQRKGRHRAGAREWWKKKRGERSPHEYTNTRSEIKVYYRGLGNTTTTSRYTLDA
jgi:hypothetical protein